MAWQQVVTILITLISGGACGALLKYWFDKRASLTQEIPVVERVNRKSETFAGIKMIKMQRDGTTREVTNMHAYQMTLRNTSNKQLRNDYIQFEFECEEIEPWVSRPMKSKLPLIPHHPTPADGTGTSPHSKVLRWQIPTLPPGDSVEFTFNVINPATLAYEVALDSDKNIITKVVTEEPERNRFGYWGDLSMTLGALAACMLAAVIYANILVRNQQTLNTEIQNTKAALKQLDMQLQLYKVTVCVDTELLKSKPGLRRLCE